MRSAPDRDPRSAPDRRSRARPATTAASESAPPARARRRRPARRGSRLVVVEALEGARGEGENDVALLDRGDVLGRHVPRSFEQTVRDCQAVEDVCALVAEHFVYRSDLLAVLALDLPAGLDHEPRHRLVVHSTLPPAYQTGPCVCTGWVSESARRMRTRPGIPASSNRSRHRRTIAAGTP